jgi:hypothetical protein
VQNITEKNEAWKKKLESFTNRTCVTKFFVFTKF